MPPSRFQALLERYCPDPADYFVAANILSRFENTPGAERLVEPLLAEAMTINAKVAAGELNSAQGRELLMDTADSGFGVPAHILADMRAALDDTVAAAGGEEEAEVAPRGEPTEHDSLIARLFAPADRPAAAAIAKAMEARPELQSRVEVLLTELARPTDMSPDQSYAFIHDFAQKIGIPSGLVTGILDASSRPSEVAHEAAVTRELVGEVSPWAQHAQRVAERQAAVQEVQRHEKNMRAPQGSEEWKAYWQNDAAKTAYREALERSIAELPPSVPAAGELAAELATTLAEAAPAPTPAAPPTGQAVG